MFTKKKIIYLSIFTIVSCFFVYNYTPSTVDFVKWKIFSKQAAEASNSMPYQIGLTNVVMIKCFTIGTPPVCTGGTMCYTKDPGTCLNYYDASGTPAGGMGSNALFSMQAVAQAGLTSGGQLIAGGMSPVLMDNGVLASAGGCFGCTAKTSGFFAKIINKFNYIIAGIRGSEK